MLDMGEPVRIDDVAAAPDRAWPARPSTIVFTGLRPGEKLHEALFGREPDVRPAHPLISHVPVPPLDPRLAYSIDAWGPRETVISELTEMSDLQVDDRRSSMRHPLGVELVADPRPATPADRGLNVELRQYARLVSSYWALLLAAMAVGAAAGAFLTLTQPDRYETSTILGVVGASGEPGTGKPLRLGQAQQSQLIGQGAVATVAALATSQVVLRDAAASIGHGLDAGLARRGAHGPGPRRHVAGRAHGAGSEPGARATGRHRGRQLPGGPGRQDGAHERGRSGPHAGRRAAGGAAHEPGPPGPDVEHPPRRDARAAPGPRRPSTCTSAAASTAATTWTGSFRSRCWPACAPPRDAFAPLHESGDLRDLALLVLEERVRRAGPVVLTGATDSARTSQLSARLAEVIAASRTRTLLVSDGLDDVGWTGHTLPGRSPRARASVPTAAAPPRAAASGVSAAGTRRCRRTAQRRVPAGCRGVRCPVVRRRDPRRPCLSRSLDGAVIGSGGSTNLLVVDARGTRRRDLDVALRAMATTSRELHGIVLTRRGRR